MNIQRVRIGRYLGTFLLSVILVQPSAGANLSLLFDSTTTVDTIEIISGQLSSTVPIDVVNDVVPDAPEDFLTGWQISLEIVPEGGAIGSVTFATPTGPAATEPPNYVLDGDNAGISVTNGGDSLLAFDFNFPPTGGVEVPIDPGSSLLLVELLASSDAVGEFGIYALTGPGGTEWTDATPVIQQVRTFVNVPVGQGPVRIGTVIARIPEPASLLLLGSATLTTICLRRKTQVPLTASSK